MGPCALAGYMSQRALGPEALVRRDQQESVRPERGETLGRDFSAGCWIEESVAGRISLGNKTWTATPATANSSAGALSGFSVAMGCAIA